MRYTIASDIGMAFELGIKTVIQGLSPNEDGEAQVPGSHDLLSDLWGSIPANVRSDVDADAESCVCNAYGPDNSGKVLPLSQYLQKHGDFLNRTVLNRYAVEGGRDQFRSDAQFVLVPFPKTQSSYKGIDCVDGVWVLMSYWRAIMKKARELRWDDERCKTDESLAADRDEAWDLVEKAIGQMFGNLKIMTQEELQEKRLGSLGRDDVDTNAASA